MISGTQIKAELIKSNGFEASIMAKRLVKYELSLCMGESFYFWACVWIDFADCGRRIGGYGFSVRFEDVEVRLPVRFPSQHGTIGKSKKL